MQLHQYMQYNQLNKRSYMYLKYNSSWFYITSHLTDDPSIKGRSIRPECKILFHNDFTKFLFQFFTGQGKAGGSFAKATFASADTADISVDDPDFWAKWAKKAEIEEIDEKTKLMMVEPRSRKKIQRFGGHENLDPAQCSDLDSSDDSDGGGGLTGRGKRKGRHSRRGRGEDDEDYMEDEREIEYGMWSKAELFKLEKAFLAFG